MVNVSRKVAVVVVFVHIHTMELIVMKFIGRIHATASIVIMASVGRVSANVLQAIQVHDARFQSIIALVSIVTSEHALRADAHVMLAIRVTIAISL
jgi:hypothetical protein